MVIALPRNNDLNDARVAISPNKGNKYSHMELKHHLSAHLRKSELSEASAIRRGHLESKSKDFFGGVKAEDELTPNRKEINLPGYLPISTPVFNLGRHFIPVSPRDAISREEALGRKEETGVTVTPEKKNKSTISCELAFDREAETRVIVSPCNESSKAFPNFKTSTSTVTSAKIRKHIDRKRYDAEQGYTPKKKRRASKEEKPVVKHTYRDYSCSLRVHTKCKPQDNMRLYPGTQFPEKIHYMLEKSSRSSLTSIFRWKSHGRAFCVDDTKAFATLVLPTYFSHSRWPSFLRQLNLYGFKRLLKGPDAGSYYHERFLRGFSRLSRDIERVKVKGIDKTNSNLEEEPDFYSMPKIGMDHTFTNNKEKKIDVVSWNKVKKANIDKPMNVCRNVIAMKINEQCEGERKYATKYLKDEDMIKYVAQSATMNHSPPQLQSEFSAPSLCGLHYESISKNFLSAMQPEDEVFLKEFSNPDCLILMKN